MSKFFIFPLTFLICFFSNHAKSQTRWELAGTGIFSNYYGEFTPKNVVSTETHGAWGAYLKYNFNQSWALRLNFTNAQISGHYHNYAAGRDERAMDFTFKNRVKVYASVIEFEPFYKKLPGKKRFTPGLSPFAAFGHSIVWHNPKTDFNDQNDQFSEELRLKIAKDMAEDNTDPALGLYLGIGSKYYFSKNIVSTFEIAIQPSFSDYLDGVSLAGNSKTNDWLMTVGLSFAYSLPVKAADSDGDGVPDSRDNCPDVAGRRKNAGCPEGEKVDGKDSDGDGVPDAIDLCPDVKGNLMNSGCPKK